MTSQKLWLAFLASCVVFQIASLTAVAQINVMPEDFSPNAQRALGSNADLLGQEVLTQGEPSFDHVVGYFPEMKRPRAVVGVKEHPDFIGVLWNGTLEIGSTRISFALGDPPSPYGIDGPVTRSLLGGYLPIVQTNWQFEGLLYQETVLGYSKNLSSDEPLWAYVRLRVTNPRTSPLGTKVTVYSDPALGGPLLSYAARVEGGAKHDFYFKIPYSVDPQHLVMPVDEPDFNRVVDETRTFWSKLLNEQMQIHTPEQRVNDGYRAWLMYNFLNVHKIKGNFDIHDGSGFYDEVYGYSAALYNDALSGYGYKNDAEKYLESMLIHQHRDGLYTTGFGTPDNGALLFALAQEYELNHDLQWFKTVTPKMIKSCEWISSTRATTKVMQKGEKPLTYGLLPPRPSYNDYQPPVSSYFSDTYNWFGMYESGLAFRQAGMTAEADKWLKEADHYRNDILASMEKAVVDVGGYKALPIEPLTQRLLKQGGGSYYGLTAPLLLETEIFGPHDKRTDWITRYMEERGGLLLGVDRFADGIDHAYTYGYDLTQLRNGNIDKFLLSFYSMFAYGMSQGTYSAVEVNHLAYGYNEMTLPHTYSNTQQLRMLRLMLVRTEGDDLLLASGTPRAWLEAGKNITVKRAPTQYGLLSYSIVSDQNGHEIHAVVEPVIRKAATHLPAHVKLWLRHPSTGGMAGTVTVNGKTGASLQSDAIELPGSMLNQKLDITVSYATPSERREQ